MNDSANTPANVLSESPFGYMCRRIAAEIRRKGTHVSYDDVRMIAEELIALGHMPDVKRTRDSIPLVPDYYVEQVAKECHAKGPASPHHVFWQPWEQTAPFVRNSILQTVKEVLEAEARITLKGLAETLKGADTTCQVPDTKKPQDAPKFDIGKWMR